MRETSFETIPGRKLTLAGGDTKGYEKPDSRLFLSLAVRKVSGWHGVPIDEEEFVQISLSVKEIAQIVQSFFYEIVWQGNYYTKCLRQLFKRRRREMSSGSYTNPDINPDADTVLDYHKLV